MTTSRLARSRVRSLVHPRRASWSRRRFLERAGLGAAFAALVPRLEAEADATSPTPDEPGPRRLLLLFTPNGTLYDKWRPHGDEFDWQLGELLEPLDRHRERLVIVDAVERIDLGIGDGHAQGMGGLWTGARLADTNGLATGVSVDQVIADAIGHDTAYRSLEFGVRCREPAVRTRMCYAGPEQPLSPRDDPYVTLIDLFGDLAGSTAELERIRHEQRSVLDAVAADLQRFAAGQSASDRHRLEAHLDGVRQIERRLDLSLDLVGSCEPITIDDQLDPQHNDNFAAITEIQLDLLVLALRCDLTRVASFQWAEAVALTRMTWLGPEFLSHHGLSHRDDDDPVAIEQLTAINRWYAQRVAGLLDRLIASDDGHGSLLDETLVVWGNELDKGNTHTAKRLPFVLAGGKAHGLVTGRVVRREETVPHNRLLVSLCHLCGRSDVETFGNGDPGAGALGGL